jgi:hypothetical protein
MIIAPVLSQYISIGSLLVGATPSPSINFLIQIAFIAASGAAMYLPYVEDIAVVLCLAFFHSTTPAFKTKTYHV